MTTESTKIKLDVSATPNACRSDVTARAKTRAFRRCSARRPQPTKPTSHRRALKAAHERRKKLVAEGKAAAGQLANSFARVSAIGGLAIAGAFAGSLKVMDDYDRKMRNVNSIAQLNTVEFNKMSAAVQKISADPSIKKGPRDLAEGLYDIYSAGYKGAEALDILRESAKSASAGVSNTKVGVDAITTALRAQIPGVTTARQAADGYFQTVNDGKISFSQLSSAIGKSAAILKAGGVSFQEYGAYMADATLKGNKSAAATIALNNLINKLSKPPKQAAEAFEEMGIKFGYAELKAVGFTAKMKEVTEKTNGNADALRKLFPDQRAFMAALNITSGGMKSYNELLVKQKSAHEGAGAAARAAAKQNEGLSNDVDQAKKNLELFALTAAGVVAPSVSKLFKEGVKLVNTFQKLPKDVQENRIKFVAFAGAALLLVSPLKSVIETGLLMRRVYIGVRAAIAASTIATTINTGANELNAVSTGRLSGGLGLLRSKMLASTAATAGQTSGFFALKAAGVTGLGAVGIAAAALVAIVWGVPHGHHWNQGRGHDGGG